MRDPTLELTGRYTRPQTIDLEQAARSLPSIRPVDDSDDNDPTTSVEELATENLAPHLPHPGDGTVREVSEIDANEDASMISTTKRNELPETDLDASSPRMSEPVGSASRRTRTFNPLIKSQPGESPKTNSGSDLRLGQNEFAPYLPHGLNSLPPDLVRVIAVWRELPEQLRAGIVAIVDAVDLPEGDY